MNIAPTATERRRGRLLLIAAAILWSTVGLFAKAPYFQEWSGAALAFWRAAFASFVLLPLVRKPCWTWRFLPMILFFVAMNYTFLTAMKLTEASNAIWLQNTAPVWVFLVGVFYFKEPLHPRDMGTIVFATAGILLILTFEIGNASYQGVLFGLLAALTYSGVVLSLRQLRDYQASWLVALNHLTTALVLSPFAFSQLQGGPYVPTGMQWLLLACFGTLQMGLPYLLFARGLHHTPSHEASGIVLIEPVLTPVWVFFAWHQHPSYEAPRWWTLVGGGLILTGLLIRYSRERTAKQVST